MNDLERDLKELFETKARSVDVTPAPPEAVLRRGRHRQVGTVIGGVVAAIAIAATVGGATWLAVRERTAPLPANTGAGRVVTVDRFTIGAPRGWSVLDTAVLRDLLPGTSESCGFAGTGVPVGPDGEPAEPSGPQPTPSCTTGPSDLPIGIPLLQVANFEPQVASTICGRLGGGSQTIAFDGAQAGLYIALDPSGDASAWPVPLEPGSGPCGEGLYSRFSSGGESYLAFAALGPDVSEGSRADLLAAFDAMVVDPDADVTPALDGAGYVVASGMSGDERWQVTAGVGITESGGAPAALWATVFSSDGSIIGKLGQAWDPANDLGGGAMQVGDGSIIIAFVPRGTGEVAWAQPGGVSTTLTQTPAPALMDQGQPGFEGAVAWGLVPGHGGELVKAEPGVAIDEPSTLGSGEGPS